MSTDTDEARGGLKQGLRQRHMTLISIGGTIGAGLFVGSGVVIGDTGPAALISFLLAGVLVMLVMRMLGEMAVARPAVGSFYEYARVGLGEWAGFTVGWLYWYFWVVVVAVEAVAGARVIGIWVPGAPPWLIGLVLLALMTATNLYSVRAFGEFEFWFSSLKVIAIVVFIAVGAAYLLGWWPDADASLAPLTGNGGFAPNGWSAVVVGAVPAVAFFVGVELVTVAAAESDEPARMVARATNSVVLRVLLFYVGSIFVVVAIVPWDADDVATSPYVAVLQKLDVPAAATVMNAIVLVAVLSSLNSGLYAASRMLFALTSRGHAPRALVKVSPRGVPLRATLIGTVVALISIGASYVSPDQVFAFLISSYGVVALFVYLLVAVSQVRLRRRLEREDPEALTFRMWLFPWLSYLTIAAMVVVIVVNGLDPGTRTEFLLSVVVLLVVLAAYAILSRVRPAR
ncbi:GABA permease [Marmoricola endophyticus]|uniref:GABA permease n=1 Tax=Marmoricola endophyticus TaxID=2040280 RepID=A0A917BIZ4_9ACTN|nr:amino acid permease [Marmoricola endophyticus]GGF41455.1 GABA permease [Marmoricola endophyticus]